MDKLPPELEQKAREIAKRRLEQGKQDPVRPFENLFYHAAKDAALAAIAYERERAAKVCEGEYVDAISTSEEADYAYNRACDDCARAIRGESASGKG